MEQKLNRKKEDDVITQKQDNRGLVERIVSAMAVIFSGIFILPVLSVLTGAFGIIGIGLPAISLLNLYGIISIPFNVLFVSLTGFPQVVVGFSVGIIFIVLSFACGSLLKKYVAAARRTF